MTKNISHLIFLVLISSCYTGPRSLKWSDIKDKRIIRFATINAAHTYFQSKDDEIEGFEFNLATQFAKDHNLHIEFIIKDSIEEVIEAVQKGEAEIGAAGITYTKKRNEYLSFSPAYFKSRQSIACKEDFKVKKMSELSKLQIIIPVDTSYSETLEKIKKENPSLTWKEVENTTSEVLLQQVWESEGLCTIIDSHILNLHRRYIPEIHILYEFAKKDQISWAIHKQSTELSSKVKNWFKSKKTNRKISELKRKYFDFIDFDPFNIKTFLKRIRSRLPQYKKLFQLASQKTGIPWELLAAISYQESYWNEKARSPTGVRGMMMLTRRTAQEMGVKNRLNPKQSIDGGARYLKKLIERLPIYINNDDKIWYALASYNVGYYHLRDSMALSIWQNENPTRWHSIEKVLPLLSHKKYYKKLPYGHARGLEPVLYVKRIKNFYDILKNIYRKTAPIKVYD